MAPLPPLNPVSLPPLTPFSSPNQSPRTHGNDAVDLIVCHTPEGSYESAHSTIMNPAAQVSYHILIREDGKAARQYANYAKKAWHAKVHNSRSEGISLAGSASRTRALSPGGRAFARVVAFRLRKRGFPPKWRRHGEVGGGFCRHADLQSDRSDPMNLSRWLTFVALVKWEYRRGGFRSKWGD